MFWKILKFCVHLDKTAVEHVVGGGGVEAGLAVAGVAAPHPAVPGLELALQPVQIQCRADFRRGGMVVIINLRRQVIICAERRTP